MNNIKLEVGQVWEDSEGIIFRIVAVRIHPDATIHQNLKEIHYECLHCPEDSHAPDTYGSLYISESCKLLKAYDSPLYKVLNNC